MRRAPQLWEQRLARTTAILGAGISSSGDATAIVPPSPPPGAGGGIEPAPVSPAPGLFIAPSAPTLFKQVQAINVLWDGLNSAGDLWPYDTAWVEIHMSTANGFTPGTATLKGRLARPGSYTVGGLTAGVPYYFKLRGADPSGSYTAASTQVSSTTGSASSGDIVTIEGDQIIGGTITGQYIAGGTVTGTYLSGGTISGGFITGGTVSGGYISGGTVSAGFITGGTIEAARFTTSALGSRVRLSDNVTGPWGTADAIEFYDGGTQAAMIHFVQGLGLDVYSNKVSFLNKAGTSGPGSVDANVFGDLTVSDALRVDNAVSFCDSGINVAFRINSSGEVFSYGVDDNTTASAANVRVGASAQLLRSTSTARLKDDLAPLDGDLAGVAAEKISSDPASVDPHDVLTITPTEFRSLSPADGDARSLGFIAEDVAIKFPWAANWDDDGLPSAIEDRPILAALLAVVKDQAATITDLRARIEALEA
jgi:hypothetical protein